MNTKAAVITGLILLVSLFIGLQSAVSAYTIDKTVAISSSASKPYTPGAVLDSFDNGVDVNAWGGVTGGFAVNGGICKKEYDSTGKALKLNYNVTPAEGFSGYFSRLGGQSVSGYTTISFMVRGQAGGEFFKVEFKNNGSNADTNHAAVYITDYLDGGVTTEWQQVAIPLHAFANISDWSSAKEFVITFEGDQSGFQGSSKQGTIYIDNITFGNSVVNAVRVNSFGTKLGRCALGGSMGSMPNAFPTVPWANILFWDNPYHSAPYGMLSQFNVSTGDQWAGHFMIFGGGDDGSIAIPHNFSGFNYLTFYVRGMAGANPKIMKVEVVDNAGTKAFVVNGISETGWTYVRIDLSSKDTNGVYLDKTSIKQMNLIYERWRIFGAGGSYGPGDFYIDDIQFEK